MLSSKVIHVDGVFLGAAIVIGGPIMSGGLGALRFYATHDSVRALHNVSMPDFGALYAQVRSLFNRNRAIANASA